MMHSKKMPLIAALTVSLAGCAGLRPTIAPLESRANPVVDISADKIALTSDVLYFNANEKNVRITWRLAPAYIATATQTGAKPSLSITIVGAVTDVSGDGVFNNKPATVVVLDRDQKEITDCASAADGLSFSCLNKNTKPGVYKYTIRVASGDTVVERDPIAVNGN